MLEQAAAYKPVLLWGPEMKQLYLRLKAEIHNVVYLLLKKSYVALKFYLNILTN